MDSKKISFSFNKSIRKPNIFTAREEPKKEIQLIDCLEEQSIRVIGEKVENKGPLVIPLRDDAKNLLDRVRETRRKEKVALEDTRPDSELTLDELAARQLLQEATAQTIQNGTKILTVPLSADKLPLNGEKEPTLEDYENVPISDFGFAVLRGMGWKDGMIIGNNQDQNIKVKEPELRPKGLGLGATKMVTATKPKVATDKEGKELQLVKGAYAKIIAGMHKGKYGEVQGLDDESSRIIIKTTISREVVSLNEFLVVPVTKKEYEKCSKILNLEKYEEYKSKENDKSTLKTEEDRRHGNSSRKVSPSNSDSSEYHTNRKHSWTLKKKSKKHRSRSRSPRQSKSRKSRHFSRERSTESDASSDSDYSNRRKHKKKPKKSKKQRDKSDNDYRSNQKSKKSRSRRFDSSSSSSDDKHRRK